jgi:hypothetical protein
LGNAALLEEKVAGFADSQLFNLLLVEAGTIGSLKIGDQEK